MKTQEMFSELQRWIDRSDHNDVEELVRAHSLGCHGSAVLGDGAELRRHLDSMRQLLVDYPHPFFQDAMLLHSISAAQAIGEPGELEQYVREFAAASTRHGRPEEAALYATVGSIGVAWERDGLETLVDLAVAITKAPNPTPAARSVAASALAHAGRGAAAVEMIDEQLASGLPDVIADASWPLGMAYWTDAAATTRHVALSRELYERLRPLAGTHLVTGGFYGGSIALHLGRLASVLDLPETNSWFEQALNEHVTLDGPGWIARTHLNWAEHLSVTGEVAGARDHAQLALDAIGERDYAVTARRARSLLAS